MLQKDKNLGNLNEINMAVETYTLYDLNEYLKRVIALNFADAIWISCEISQCKNVKGNYYLDLVQQNESEEIIAQSSAAIWYKTALFLKSKLGDILPSLLMEGVQIKVKVRIEFNERYGLKLIIEDIDPSYTLGQMEMNRQKILERLKNEEVLDLNKARPLPSVLQRLAVISSDSAAGFKDFEVHLSQNQYGYFFKLDLYKAAMQGSNTEPEVVQAIKSIQESDTQYDAIILIRGGGSKIDLSAFDNFNIGYAIATSSVPVITGIGHEIDVSIADVVAHKSLKTPTAVADFLLERNAIFEGEISQMVEQIYSFGKLNIRNEMLNLHHIDTVLITKPKEVIKQQLLAIDQMMFQIKMSKDWLIKHHNQTLKQIDHVINLADPKSILKRGFALLKNGNDIILSKKELLSHSNVTAVFIDGEQELSVVK
jgi:exodeoxyribonuclease VII large subunit